VKATAIFSVLTMFVAGSYCPAAYADFGDGNDFGTIPEKPRQAVNPAARALNAQKDGILIQQMQKVAEYMQLWCRRNSRVPEPGDQTNAVQADLTTMLQNNPYTPQDIRTARGSQLQEVVNPSGGQMYGALGYDYDVDVTIAQQINRIIILRNDSLSKDMIDDYTVHPPADWTAPAGTITIIGSNQGSVLVWGAGSNGRPVCDPLTGRAMMIYSQWGTDNQDSTSPNEDI
jgi:hypothetical protein